MPEFKFEDNGVADEIYASMRDNKSFDKDLAEIESKVVEALTMLDKCKPLIQKYGPRIAEEYGDIIAMLLVGIGKKTLPTLIQMNRVATKENINTILDTALPKIEELFDRMERKSDERAERRMKEKS